MYRPLSAGVTSLIGALVAAVVVLTGVVAPAQAVGDRVISGQVRLGSLASHPAPGQIQVEYTRAGEEHDPTDFVITDASGNYSITGLEPGPYYLYARYVGSSAYVSQWFGEYPNAPTMSTASAITGNSSSTTLHQPQNVIGTVSLGSPATPAIAHVEASYRRRETAQSYSAWSAPVTVDSNGSYSLPSLPPGTYEIRYPYVGSDRAFQTDRVETGIIVRGTFGATQTRNVTLQATNPLTGSVTLGAGGSSAGAGEVQISFERHLGGETYVPEPTLSTVTDASGQFSILVNPLTSYRVTFTYVGSGGFQAVTTSPTRHSTGVPAHVIIPAVHTLSGHVDLFDAFGPPTPATTGEVVVRLVGGTAQSGPTGPYLYAPVPVDSSGDWQIPDVREGTYYVRIDYEGGVPHFRPYEFFTNSSSFYSLITVSEDILDLDHVYGSMSSLAGVVTDSAGEPLAGVSVLLTGYLTRDDQEWYSRSVVTDAAGRYQFHDISTGAGYYHAIDFDLAGYSPAQYPGWGYYYSTEYVELPVRTHIMLDTVVLTLPGSISGTITSPNISPQDFAAGLVEVEVMVFDSDARQWVSVDEYTVQPDGTYSIPDLYIDDYRLKITYRDFFTSTHSPTLSVGEGEHLKYDGSITATPPAVTEFYAELGGASGPLGAATTALLSFPNNGGGTLQHFANGSIYSSPNHGTFVVWAGPIRDQYFAANSILGEYGWPTTPEFCGWGPGFEYRYCSQGFSNEEYLSATSLGVNQRPVVIGLPLVGAAVSVAPAFYYPDSPTSYTYAWLRDGVEIPGATGATYAPVAADLGHRLDVRVTGYRAGYLPTVSLSYPGPTVGPSAASQIANKYAAAGGSAGPLGAATTAVVSFPHNGGGVLQHFANGSIYVSSSGAFVVLAGPIRDQYWAANSVMGLLGWPQADVVCSSSTCEQYFTGGTLSAPRTVASTPPAISGTAIEGGTLTASNGTYTPTATTFTYAWYRDGVRIAGAAAKTYSPVAADVGRTLTVEVTARSASGLPVTTTSAPTGVVAPSAASQIAALRAENPSLGAATTAVVAFPNGGGGSLQHFANGSIYSSGAGGTRVVPTGAIRDAYFAANSILGVYGWPTSAQVCDLGGCSQTFVGGTLSAAPLVVTTPPTIAGSPRVGGALVARPGAYTPAAQTFGYAWYRDDVRIAGATASTYTPSAADEGRVISVEVTAGRTGSVAVTTRSVPTAAVAPSAASQIAALRASTPSLGAAATAVVAFADGGGGSLQHYANGSIYSSNAGGTWVVPAGPIREAYWAANSIFGLYAWPAGPQVCSGGSCSQTFVGGTLTAAPLAVAVAPSLSGTPRVGGALVANTGSYTPGATTFAYRWLRDGETPIAGATGPTYVPTAADEGHVIHVEITAGRSGSVPVIAASAPSAAIGPSAASAIGALYEANSAVLGAPTTGVVSFPDGGGGSLRHFVNGSIYSSNLGGTWIVPAGPVRDVYWAANSIFGAYRWPTGPQECADGSCRQSFVGGMISTGPLVMSTAPSVVGSPRVGTVLTARPGSYAPAATTVTYRWYRNGTTLIAGATSATYLPTAADLGHTLQVEITASRAGSVATTNRSASTPPIGPSFASAVTELHAANSAQLGDPTTAVVSFPDNGGGALQHYRNGSIYSSATGGTWIVPIGGVRTAYWNANSIFGAYQWPSGPQECSAGTCTQQFVGGVISAPTAP